MAKQVVTWQWWSVGKLGISEGLEGMAWIRRKRRG